MAQQIYQRYAGDTDVAVVVDGVCQQAFVRGQTGGTVSTRDGREWGWQGLTVAALKAEGFTYKWTEDDEPTGDENGWF